MIMSLVLMTPQTKKQFHYGILKCRWKVPYVVQSKGSGEGVGVGLDNVQRLQLCFPKDRP